MKAEVKGNQSQEVDWTKNPQLVVSNIGKIVLAHQDQKKAFGNDCFVGTRFDDDFLSEYSTKWIKSNFKPFHGEITLKND